MNYDNSDRNLDTPKITVTMPVYNGEKYLREAIDSILNQTYDDFELLIINDGSTDGSFEIMKSYNDPRIRILQNETNLGLVVTRNRGISNARGEYIAILDCDDIAYPNRLAEQVTFMDTHPEFSMIGSGVEIIDKSGNSNGNIWQYDAPAATIPSILLFHNYFVQSSMFIRKKCLPEVCYRTTYAPAEDYDLWVRMASGSKVWNLPQILNKYREHIESISFVKAELQEKCVNQIIMEYLLNSLGIELTPLELKLHRHLGRKEFSCNRDFVVEAESWLLKLLETNTKKRYFADQQFRSVVAEYWFSVCNAAVGLGLWVLKKYWLSPLTRKTTFPAKMKIGFTLRSLFGSRYISG